MAVNTAVKWAYGKKITGITAGFTHTHGQMPVSHVELTTLEGEHTRITPRDFSENFETFPHTDGSICRLKNEQMMKAKDLAMAEQVEQIERKEHARLTEKYGDK